MIVFDVGSEWMCAGRMSVWATEHTAWQRDSPPNLLKTLLWKGFHSSLKLIFALEHTQKLAEQYTGHTLTLTVCEMWTCIHQCAHKWYAHTHPQ